MAGGLPVGRKSKKWDFLGGGLVTRPDDRYIDLLNDKGHLFSPSESNFQFNKIGSIQKRLGYARNGSAVQNGEWLAQKVANNTVTVLVADSAQTTFCFQWQALSSAPLVFITERFYLTGSTGFNRGLITNIKCVIKSDSAGVPGTTLATSNALNDGYEIASASLLTTENFFYFPTPLSVVNGTTYWFCLQMDVGIGAAAQAIAINVKGVNTTGTVKYSTAGYGSYTTNTNFIPYIIVQSSDKPILGLYDYRPQAAGVLTQFPMVACNGTLYYYNAGYTSIASGLASAANSLYDFATLKNYLFECDYATSNNQVWDGANAVTMTHGYRPVMAALGQSGSAGGPWSAAGIVKVMLITQLVSGGYRASIPLSITLGSTTNKIDLTAIAVNAVAAQFSFDIGATATTIACTLPNGSIYYKVPAASLSTAGNPIANTQTTNSILPMTDATLIAGGNIETVFGYPQAYFTGQVATPKAKYMEPFQDMLCMAGDPNKPNRVWISEQYAPQVFGDGSSGDDLTGNFLDIATDDGEIITGLKVSDRALMVAKQHAIYRVDFTGNASQAFIVNKVHGEIGVLSNWTMQVIPDGLFFLSDRGPAICYGTYSDVLPQTRLIQNLFDNTLSTTSFNLASMVASVACNDTTRNQILFTVASNGVTIRDRVMFYDYEQKMFGLDDGYQANYIAAIGDSNGFPILWTGNLSGQAFKRTNANDSNPYFDNGAAIITQLSTPDMDFGDPSTMSQLDWLHIAGLVQTSGNLYLDFYANNATTPYRTVSLDQTSALFAQGLAVRVGAVIKGFKLRIRGIDFTGVSTTEIHWMRLEYSDSGGTRLG